MIAAGTAMARVIAHIAIDQSHCNDCGAVLWDGCTQCRPCRQRERDEADDKERLPYPWCRMPEKCGAKGYCQRDPNCGD